MLAVANAWLGKSVTSVTYVFVRALKGKWVELSTPRLAETKSMAGLRHAKTLKAKSQKVAG